MQAGLIATRVVTLVLLVFFFYTHSRLYDYQLDRHYVPLAFMRYKENILLR